MCVKVARFEQEQQLLHALLGQSQVPTQTHPQIHVITSNPMLQLCLTSKLMVYRSMDSVFHPQGWKSKWSWGFLNIPGEKGIFLGLSVFIEYKDNVREKTWK